MEKKQQNNTKVKDVPLKSISDVLVKAEPKLIKFDWENQWLKGEEYYYILTHVDLYAKGYGFKTYPLKTHPDTTYSNPLGTSSLILDGTIYFVEGLSTGADFGFPRIEAKKRFRW